MLMVMIMMTSLPIRGFRGLFWFIGFLLITLLQPACAAPATYYFSSSVGSDWRTIDEARRPGTPWKSLDKSRSLVLGPGDRLALCEGDTWFSEQLFVVAMATWKAPAMVTSYRCHDNTSDDSRPRLLGSIRIWASNLHLRPWAKNPNVLIADMSSFLEPDTILQSPGIYVDNELFVKPRTPNLVNFDLKWGNGEEVLCGNEAVHVDDIGKRVVGGEQFKRMMYPTGLLQGAEAVIRKKLYRWTKGVVVEHRQDKVWYRSQDDVSSDCVYFQNKLEFLDSEGEAFYDVTSRLLYLYPRPGKPITTIDLVLRKHDAGVLIGLGTRNIVIERLIVEFSLIGIDVEATEQQDTLDTLASNSKLNSSVHNVTIRNCVITRGHTGIRHNVPRGVNVFERNVITWMTSGGIGGFKRLDAESGTPIFRAVGNQIHQIGYVSGWDRGIGIYAGEVYDNVVSHTGYTSIFCVYFYACKVARNVVWDYMLQLADGAAIYASLSAHGHGWKHIWDNVIVDGFGNWDTFINEWAYLDHKVHQQYIASQAIYLDHNTTQRFVVDNNTAINARGVAFRNNEVRYGDWTRNFCYTDSPDDYCFDLTIWNDTKDILVKENWFMSRERMLKFQVYGIREHGQIVTESPTWFQQNKLSDRNNTYCSSAPSMPTGSSASTLLFLLAPAVVSFSSSSSTSWAEGNIVGGNGKTYSLESYRKITEDATEVCSPSLREDMRLRLVHALAYVDGRKREWAALEKQLDEVMSKGKPPASFEKTKPALAEAPEQVLRKADLTVPSPPPPSSAKDDKEEKKTSDTKAILTGVLVGVFVSIAGIVGILVWYAYFSSEARGGNAGASGLGHVPRRASRDYSQDRHRSDSSRTDQGKPRSESFQADQARPRSDSFRAEQGKVNRPADTSI